MSLDSLAPRGGTSRAGSERPGQEPRHAGDDAGERRAARQGSEHERADDGQLRARGEDAGQQRVPPVRQLVLMLGLIAAWGLLMQRFGGDDIYSIMGPYALGVSALIAALSARDLRRWLRPTRHAVSLGLAVGVVMTLLTYPLFSLARLAFPDLDGAVSALYTTAHRTGVAAALPWVLAIIVAEELLWRGALLHVLARRVPKSLAMALSVLSYALAQFGSGSWIVMLLAVVCGSLWTLQRHFTGSVLSPLISHLIWTPVVILLHPVTPG